MFLQEQVVHLTNRNTKLFINYMIMNNTEIEEKNTAKKDTRTHYNKNHVIRGR